MLDKWIEQLKKGNCISESDLKKLCVHVKNLLMEEIRCQLLQVKLKDSQLKARR